MAEEVEEGAGGGGGGGRGQGKRDWWASAPVFPSADSDKALWFNGLTQTAECTSDTRPQPPIKMSCSLGHAGKGWFSKDSPLTELKKKQQLTVHFQTTL